MASASQRPRFEIGHQLPGGCLSLAPTSGRMRPSRARGVGIGGRLSLSTPCAVDLSRDADYKLAMRAEHLLPSADRRRDGRHSAVGRRGASRRRGHDFDGAVGLLAPAAGRGTTVRGAACPPFGARGAAAAGAARSRPAQNRSTIFTDQACGYGARGAPRYYQIDASGGDFTALP